jgi:succinoglycan biosynthesis protein ExoA
VPERTEAGAGDRPPPAVTVVIPARNEALAIGACLDSILAQTWSDIEILVVDGASTDGTPAVVRSYSEGDPRVRLLANPRAIVPTGLNIALGEARGRWLVRVDAHAVVPPEYVERAVRRLETGQWGGVGGRKDGVGRTAAGRAIAAAMTSRFGVGNSTYHYGLAPQPVEHVPFGAYPVELARALGGWDERLRVNQDFEFDYRLRLAGHTLLFDPEISIEWECRQRVRDLYRQYRRYGEGKVAVALLHPRSMRARHLAAPALILSWFVAGGLLARGKPRLAQGVLAPYVAALGVATLRTATDLDPGARMFVAPAFVAMHVGWGVGFWRGITRAARHIRPPSAHL